MRENLTEIVFILDRSGSMSGLESDTIGGFNSLINKQQKEDGEALISTVLFDDEAEVIHDRVPIKDVKKLTEDDYYVRGCTALLDAVGGAIHHIGNVHKYAREEDRPAKTLFVITTDGMENASRRYSFKDIKRMIERQKERYHWEFLFLGANIDAAEVAGEMGISRDRAANYNCDEEGTVLNYRVLEAAVTCARKCKSADIATAFDGGDWKEDIDRDYENRGKRRMK
ncbi:MAG: VWA domain-containing protein [Eubacterium sp.]|nr:VWA domain-containing protein [Eubacterium sp.]